MLFSDIIGKKRDGSALDDEEIAFFVAGLADASLPAEQVSAFAMAIFFQSMNFAEAASLTTAMASSGTVLNWDTEGLDGPVVDKHSTGGIGDKASFLLAPIVAACGCYVPMISGRGLGHTGGTLDKISSIPGYCATPDLEQFRRVVRAVGCAIIGQTAELAPADRRFYAIRDVTGTVECIPLITASILSKKIAAGNRYLVLDVKWGTGGFMRSLDEAGALANSILNTATHAGLHTHALITDMNENLGLSAGNALEIHESVRFLSGAARETRLNSVVLELSAEMLLASGLESDRASALRKAEEALNSGAAAERFARMVHELGGPADFMDRYAEYLPRAAVEAPVLAERDGYLAGVDARKVGTAIIGLGGGRRQTGDTLDLATGFTDIVPIGTQVSRSSPLAVVHAQSTAAAEQATREYRDACTIGEQAPGQRPVVNRTLTPK